jgi:N-acetylmuramoyl-L-alanine amidase
MVKHLFLLATLLAVMAPPVSAAQSPVVIGLIENGAVVPVNRGADGRDAAALVRALLAGPAPAEAARGLSSAFPPGTTLVSADSRDGQLTLQLALPQEFFAAFDAWTSELQEEQVWYTLTPLDVRGVMLTAAGPDGVVRPLAEYLPDVARPVKDAGDVSSDTPGHTPIVGGPTPPAPDRPVGPLSGKTVYISAGHGWLWGSTYQGTRWYTQRPPYQDLIEDHNNAEAVNWYLINYLYDAGADVWTVRERDFNTQELIVDNDAGAPGYTETGARTTSGMPGYNNGSYRYATAGGSTTATATWTPAMTTAGYYGVYAWYKKGSNRINDARYQVYHSGGMTEVTFNEELHGSTWRYLGTFYFTPGAGQHVTLINQTATQPGDVVVADAMRFGGGMGSLDPGGGTSGQPRWEEGSLLWAAYQGYPVDYSDDSLDVTVRPLYSEWEREASDDPVYLAWHTNGGGVRGTESYIYNGVPTTGSLELQASIHGELINDLRAAWDPAWTDRGQRTANFGELRELSTMPGTLVELAFHDNVDDAAALKEPEFERIAARAMAEGIVKYYAARDGAPVRLAPEPPTHLTVRNVSYQSLRIAWRAPASGGAGGDPAQSYRVYVSPDGFGWNAGIPVAGTVYTLTGQTVGQIRYVRVAAVNQGGESLPTPVIAARVANQGGVPFLMVNDFDLLYGGMLIPEDTPQPISPTYNLRMALDRMNRYNYVVQHANAFPSGYVFDGVQRDAVVDGDVSLLDYRVVDWLSGVDWRYRNQGGIDAGVQSRLGAFLGAGRGLLVSGSEIGWDLVNNNLGAAFYRNTLHADFVADDANTYAVTAVPGSVFDGLGTLGLDDGTHGVYNVRWPDQITPYAGSQAALSYQGGTGGTAAVQYAGTSRLIMLAFPLEGLYGNGQRAAVLARALPWLLNAGNHLYLPWIVRH